MIRATTYYLLCQTQRCLFLLNKRPNRKFKIDAIRLHISHVVYKYLKEQYRYLHHALVHTLTLPWEPVKVDYFPHYIQQNKGAKLHEQFKVCLYKLR